MLVALGPTDQSFKRAQQDIISAHVALER